LHLKYLLILLHASSYLFGRGGERGKERGFLLSSIFIQTERGTGGKRRRTTASRSVVDNKAVGEERGRIAEKGKRRNSAISVYFALILHHQEPREKGKRGKEGR